MSTTKKTKTGFRLVVQCIAAIAVWAAAVTVGCSSDNAATTGGGDASVDATADAAAEASTMCTGTQTLCGTACVETGSDLSNCGVCGAKCGPSLVCSKGQCAIGCGGGTTLCGNSCFDTMSDPSHCGACATKCAAGQVCSTGACALSCAGGTTKCGASCVDTKVDGANCGMCATTCGAGLVCSNGACSISCGQGLTMCGGSDAGGDAGSMSYCANTQTDNNNCGICATTCAAGKVCSNGTCALTCQAGLINCNGRCVDPQTSNSYCGATTGCGNDAGSAGTVCGSGQLCSGGSCGLSCQAGLINCNGTCVDPLSSNTYCGATSGCGAADAGIAGTTCAGGQVCSAGMCSLSCQAGLINCGGTCVNPNTDRGYCGASGNCTGGNAGVACANGQVCNTGTCSVSCPGSQVNCGGTCVNPSTDRAHCGASGNCTGGNAGVACANGQVCNTGTCSVSCPGSQINCSGTCVDPSTDRGHCGPTGLCGNGGGSAGVACGNGLVCSGGNCIASCAAPLINCGGTCVDPRIDPAHCNGCSACASVANSSNPVCRSSACAVGTCTAGFADCNGTYSDGCEVNLKTNNSNCGFCGTVCSGGTPFCMNGACSSIPTGVVHCWPGEGNGNDVVSGNNASVQPDVTYTGGRSGLAFHCSGASGGGTPPTTDAEAMARPSISSTGPWTYEMWIRRTSSNADAWIFDRQYRLFSVNGSPLVDLHTDASGNAFWYIRFDDGAAYSLAGVSLPVSTWVHVAVTRSGGTYSHYVNGALVGSVVDGNPVHALTPDPPRWCGHIDAAGSAMVGEFDSIRIWNRALSAAEVANVAAGNGSCSASP